MNYKILKIPNQQIVKALLLSTLAAGLFFAFSKIITPQESNSSLPSCLGFSGTKSPGLNCTLPSCAAVTSPNPSVNCLPNCSATNLYSGPANPGVNCYYLDLPLCTATASSVSIADSGTIPAPRQNCADLIDMPLCSQLSSASRNSSRNCVNECNQTNDSTDTATGGHNKSCIRFCDRLPSGMTANPRTTTSVGNCIYRYCHQLDSTVMPSATNCRKTVCNRLTPDELDENRMQSEDDPYFAEYCDGSTNKCYEFTAAQLPFVRYRYNNTMCQIHSCKPATISCGRKDNCNGFTLGSSTTDDTQNIACNNSSLTMSDGSVRHFADTVANGTNVPGLYSQYINIGLPLTDTSLCKPVLCRPTIYTPYPCSNDANGRPTSRNIECDSSGDGSVCATTACVSGAECRKDLGYCYRTVDCNNQTNSTRPECAVSAPEDSSDIDPVDDTDSWFHRPKPLDKSYNNDNPTQGYRVSNSCYSKSDLQSQTDNSGVDGCDNGSRWGCDVRYDLGLFTINLGYFHMQLGPDDRTRSPRMCDVIRNGSRGTGYGYLCGNNSNVYAMVSPSTAYHQGYIKTNYFDNGDSISTTTVCLRFKNAMRPNDATMPNSETCGSRECAVSCAFGICKGQICGFDVCRDLTVQYSNSKECAMNNDMFNNANDNKRCAAVVDNFLRLRAIQYGHKVCTFLDSKGQFAYNNMFFSGNETLNNGVTCVSGSYNSVTRSCEGGKNTNDVPGVADKWRTVLRIRYTEGNTAQNGINGFYDKNGKFVPAQECAKVPLKSSPPDLYNLASKNNSMKLFTPPLSIIAVHDKRGGSNAIDSTAYSLGTTDFLYPEIVVRFGITNKTLSMGAGYSGYEVTKDPASYAIGTTALSTTLNNIPYTAEVLIKKDVDPYSNQPLLCLYRRIIGSSGNTDIKISCVNRSLPEINNANTTAATTIGVRKLSISAVTTGTNSLTNGLYQDATLQLKYCYDSNCTNTNVLSLTNSNPDLENCDGVDPNNMEKYKICIKREKCSKLWKECMENEVAIQNSGLTSTRNSVRSDCQSLATQCNAKKGISSSSASLIEQINAPTADPAAYGWFNELCITSGFKTKLKQVYNQTITTGSGATSLGKCKLDTASLARSQCTATTIAAADWGSNCNCLTYDPNSPTPSGYDSQPRQQTAREAGLCIDIPTPKICSAINYSGDSFNASSIDGTSYSTNGGTVNAKHSDRNSSIVGSGSSNGGHGEFPTSVAGMNNVSGTCNGFWQPASSGNAQLTPKMNCLDDSTSASAGKWSGLLTTSNSASCARYYCPAITTGNTTNNSDVNGLYSNGLYNPGENTADSINEVAAQAGDLYGITYRAVTLGNRGSSNGFAVWNQYTKTNDFLETTSGISAASCIAGYTATTLPTKKCNQLGIWKTTSGTCVRRTCPAINPIYNPSTSQDWQQWIDSGGASFGVEVYLRDGSNPNGTQYLAGQPILTGGNTTTHLTPASRSSTLITPGSTRKGYCNKYLGFFQAGLSQPEVDCRSDGSWSAVRNPCISSCTAITSPSANDGNATWQAASTTSGGATSVVVQGTCRSGYVKYPYSRFNNDAGQPISPVPTVNTTSTEYPHRTCGLVPIYGGGYANSWSAVSSTCVNQCPGYAIDSREGVGKTTYSTSQFGQISVRWNSTNGGATDIQTVGYNSSGTQVGYDNINTQTAADYAVSGRTNGYFIVTRYCNPTTYIWDAPLVQCAKNAGVISNATFGTALGSNPTQSTLLFSFVASNATTSTTCASGYSSSPTPSYRCQPMASNSNIDQYYYSQVSGNSCSAITCQLTNNHEYRTGSVYRNENIATVAVAVGTQVNLSCSSGFGHARLTDNSGSNNTCGITVTDRTSTGPTMTCTNNNGTGTWQISNACEACRTCSSSSTFVAGTTSTTSVIPWTYAGCSGNNDNCYFAGGYSRANIEYQCGNGDDRNLSIYPTYPDNVTTIASGGSSTGSINSCGFTVEFTFACHDGYYRVTKSSTAGNPINYYTPN